MPSGTAAVQLRGCSLNNERRLPAFLPAGGVAVPLPCRMPRERGVSTEALPNCPRTLFLGVRLTAVYLMRDAKKGSSDLDVGMHPAISPFDEVKYYIQHQIHCHKSLTYFNSLYLTRPSQVSGGSPDEKRIRIK